MTNCLKHNIVLAIMALTLIMAACSRGGGNGQPSGDDKARVARLLRLDDSIGTLAPSAQQAIRRGMDSAKDSTTYYEYYVRQARVYALSDSPMRADSMLGRVTAFAERQCAQAPTPRLRSLYAAALNTRGALYHNFHRNTQQTVQLYRKTYELLQQSDNKQCMPKTCANLADAYIQSNDIPSAALWYRRALFLVDSLRLPERENITLYMGLAQVYMSLSDFNRAAYYYNATERYFDQMHPGMQDYYLNNLGNMHYYAKNYARALQVFLRLKSVIERNGMQNNFDMYLCKVNLADVYLNLGNTELATRYLDEAEPFFRRMDDETGTYYCNTIRIGIAARRGDTAGVRWVLDSEHTKGTIPYNLVNIRGNYMQRYYEQTGNYRMAYRNLSDNVRYTDSLEHNRASMRSAEIMARFTADTLQLHHQLAMELKNTEIHKAQTTVAAIVAMAIVALLLLAVWMMHLRRKRSENRMNIMNLKLQNVRNRISPHFMFNVLNNKIITSGDDEAAELTKLARLIRTNLDMSSRPYVRLSEEIDFVRQYVGVERFLLGDDFEFSLNISPDVDTERAVIPAMFMQILTENAIVHGLKGLDRPKRLDISITRDGCYTNIRVADNGPGFNARALRKKTGLGIISQTIAVANEHNKNKMRFDIRNTADSDGHASGCEATLRVPDSIRL